MSDKNNEVKEIDLLELFRLIGKGIKNGFLHLFKAIVFLFVFGVKKAHFILLFVVFGGAIGWLFFTNTQRYYSSDMIAQPNGISAVDMVDYISDLTILCKSGNTEGLAYSLKMPDTTAKKIKIIEAFHYIDVNKDGRGDFIDFDKAFNASDTTKRIVSNRIYLQVEVYSNSMFVDVKDGIFNYIDNNPYLTKLNELRKKELNELITQTESEITKLDSLQNVDYFRSDNKFASSNDSRLMFLSEKEKKMYYQDKLSLINRKQCYEKEFELATAPITIIKDFTHLTMAKNTKGRYVVRFGFWFGFFGFLTLLFLNFRKKITVL